LAMLFGYNEFAEFLLNNGARVDQDNDLFCHPLQMYIAATTWTQIPQTTIRLLSYIAIRILNQTPTINDLIGVYRETTGSVPPLIVYYAWLYSTTDIIPAQLMIALLERPDSAPTAGELVLEDDDWKEVPNTPCALYILLKTNSTAKTLSLLPHLLAHPSVQKYLINMYVQFATPNNVYVRDTILESTMRRLCKYTKRYEETRNTVLQILQSNPISAPLVAQHGMSICENIVPASVPASVPALVHMPTATRGHPTGQTPASIARQIHTAYSEEDPSLIPFRTWETEHRIPSRFTYNGGRKKTKKRTYKSKR
jgi:hypothetical protein